MKPSHVTGELIVRNTPENMALVETFIDTLTSVLPINVAFNTQIVQADGDFLRKPEEEHASRAPTYLPGMIRLIGIWKPEGAADAGSTEIMQAAFMRANLDPVGPAAK